MKIAFDAKRAFLNSSGLGNYARTIIKSLIKNNSSQLFLYTTQVKQNEFYLEINNEENVTLNLPKTSISKILKNYWRQFLITSNLNKNNIDVYHGLSNELPLNIKYFKGKKIVTIHDLIFLRIPEYYNFFDKLIYTYKFKLACKNADVIIAISNETKKDIITYFNIDEDKIKVIYQSCDDAFYKTYSENEKLEVSTLHNLPNNYLLYVGTIEKRKNLLTIIKALKQIKDIPLVVIGKQTNYFNEVNNYIVANNLQNRVMFLTNVTNHQLPIIYQNACIFIYPSLIEGFGIPIIEALVSKTPVITNTEGCFREAGGPNTVYINAYDDKEMAQKINELLANVALRNDITEKGFLYAQKFNKQTIASQLMILYNS